MLLSLSYLPYQVTDLVDINRLGEHVLFGTHI